MTEHVEALRNKRSEAFRALEGLASFSTSEVAEIKNRVASNTLRQFTDSLRTVEQYEQVAAVVESEQQRIREQLASVERELDQLGKNQERPLPGSSEFTRLASHVQSIEEQLPRLRDDLHALTDEHSGRTAAVLATAREARIKVGQALVEFVGERAANQITAAHYEHRTVASFVLRPLDEYRSFYVMVRGIVGPSVAAPVIDYPALAAWETIHSDAHVPQLSPTLAISEIERSNVEQEVATTI